MSVSVYRISFQIRDNLHKYIMYTPVHVLQEEGKRPDTMVRNQIIHVF